MRYVYEISRKKPFMANLFMRSVINTFRLLTEMNLTYQDFLIRHCPAMDYRRIVNYDDDTALNKCV